MRTDLSIIIVNYNTGKVLRACLESIKSNIKRYSYEVIVVDNNSSDNTDNIMSEYSWVKYIKSNVNNGFSKANNMGIKVSKGEFILLLNPDTIVLEGSIDGLVEYAKNNAICGAIGPQLVDLELNKNGCFGFFPSIRGMYIEMFKLDKLFPKIFWKYKNSTQKVPEFITDVFEVGFPSGACLLIQKSKMEQVGFLDEDFFMYFEEATLCQKLKKIGYKQFVIPNLKVIHLERQSSQQFKSLSNKSFRESELLYYKKFKAPYKSMLLKLTNAFIRSVKYLKQILKKRGYNG